MKVTIDISEGTRVEMGLDLDQFEEFRSDLIAHSRQSYSLFTTFGIDSEGTIAIMAFRPRRNPRGQYYSVEHTFKIDRLRDVIRCEVVAIDMMDSSQYIEFCIDEYGEAPPDMIADLRLN